MLTMDARDVGRVIAAELREHPERWTQGKFARNAQGLEVDYNSEQATCWCLYGFIRRLLNIPPGWGTPIDILSAFDQAAVGKPYYGEYISEELAFVGWQDEPGRTVADIIAVCALVVAS